MGQGKFEFQQGKNLVDRNGYYDRPPWGISGSPVLSNQEVSSSIRIAIFLGLLAAWSYFLDAQEESPFRAFFQGRATPTDLSGPASG